jgi:hypothetical protein
VQQQQQQRVALMLAVDSAGADVENFSLCVSPLHSKYTARVFIIMRHPHAVFIHHDRLKLACVSAFGVQPCTRCWLVLRSVLLIVKVNGVPAINRPPTCYLCNGTAACCLEGLQWHLLPLHGSMFSLLYLGQQHNS